MTPSLLTYPVFVLGFFVGQANQAAPSLEGATPDWVAAWRERVDEQMALLSNAYALDATMQEALRIELEQRMYQQQAWEKKNDTELDELIKKAEEAGNVEGSPELEAVWAKMAEYERMPLSEEPVESWLQKQLPPAVVEQGHVRWQELRDRRAAIGDADEIDSTKGSQISSEMGQTRLNAEAVASPDTGQPLPTGEKGQQLYAEAEARAAEQSRLQPYQVPSPVSQTPVEPSAKFAQKQDPRFDPATGRRLRRPIEQPPESGQPSEPVKTPPAAPIGVASTPQSPAAPPPVYQTAPPLDDWDKFVISFAEKYQFSEGQVTNARSILRALKTRANQYRMSRSSAFAQAELMVDAKARGEQLKQLNRPLDALFDELKQRLESLPTQEQKHQANAPQGKPVGKK